MKLDLSPKLKLISKKIEKKTLKTPKERQKESFSLDFPFLFMSFEKIKNYLGAAITISIKSLVFEENKLSLLVRNSLLHKKGLSFEVIDLNPSSHTRVEGSLDFIKETGKIRLLLREFLKTVFSSQEIYLDSNFDFSGIGSFRKESTRLKAEIKGSFSENEIKNKLFFSLESGEFPAEIKKASCSLQISRKSSFEVEIKNDCFIPIFS